MCQDDLCTGHNDVNKTATLPTVANTTRWILKRAMDKLFVSRESEHCLGTLPIS
jgi:hypothetical protein